MQRKISINRCFHIAIIVFIFSVIIINHINFSFKDNTLISELDAGYGHQIHGAYNLLQKIISEKAPIETISILKDINLSQQYIAFAFLLVPKSLISFKMLHLLPLLLALAGIYLLTNKIQGHKAALVALLFCSSAPGLISFSRQIWTHFHLSIGLVWGIFFILKSNAGKNSKYLVLSAIILTMTATLHYAAAFYVTLVLSALIVTIPEERFYLLSFWILINTINFFLPPPTNKILIAITIIGGYMYQKKNINIRNLTLMLGIFSLFISLSIGTALTHTSTNAKYNLIFSESFYFLSFIAPLCFIYFIFAFSFLLNRKQNREAKIVLASLIIPETIMLSLQMTGTMPFARGLSTYISLYILIFISSACFLTSIKKGTYNAILFFSILLFSYHSIYLPQAKINKTATHTLKLFQPNKDLFGKKQLQIFLDSLPEHSAIGVLHPYEPEDIYPGEVSFADATALWLMSKNNIRVFPIATPAKSSPGQMGLLNSDYFIFEKSKNPHPVVLETENMLRSILIFSKHISIDCTNKEIVVYKKKKISQLLKDQIGKIIYRRLAGS